MPLKFYLVAIIVMKYLPENVFVSVSKGLAESETHRHDLFCCFLLIRQKNETGYVSVRFVLWMCPKEHPLPKYPVIMDEDVTV